MLKLMVVMVGYIDIFRKIYFGMVVYPNNPEVGLMQVQKAGDNKNSLTHIELGAHTGTHIDSPAHIREGSDGAPVRAVLMK